MNKSIKETFQSRGQQAKQIYLNKKSCYRRKWFNSHRIGLGYQHGHHFIVLGSLHSKSFHVVSGQRTRNRSRRPREKWGEKKSREGVGIKGRKPSPSPFVHFLALVPFFARPKPKISLLVVPRSFFAKRLLRSLCFGIPIKRFHSRSRQLCM